MIKTRAIGTLTVHDVSDQAADFLNSQHIPWEWDSSIFKFVVDLPPSTQEVLGVEDTRFQQCSNILLLPLGFVLTVTEQPVNMERSTRLLIKASKEYEKHIWQLVHPTPA